MKCISANLVKIRRVNMNGKSESEGSTCLRNKNFTVLASFKRLETSPLYSRDKYARATIDKTIRVFTQVWGRTQPRDGIWDRGGTGSMPTACAQPERAPDQGDKCSGSECQLEVSIVLEHGGEQGIQKPSHRRGNQPQLFNIDAICGLVR